MVSVVTADIEDENELLWRVARNAVEASAVSVRRFCLTRCVA
jgi:hypothetical protein